METLESLKYASLKEHQELVEVFLTQCKLVNGLMSELMFPPITLQSPSLPSEEGGFQPWGSRDKSQVPPL